MTETRKLPAQSKRVETGSVQFGEDWPGVFIRGDDAFAYGLQLRSLLKAYVPGETEALSATNIMGVAGCAALARLLESCNVHKEADE